MPDVDFTEVSAADRPDLVKSLKIRGAPTVLAYRDGLEVTRTVGAVNIEELQQLFASSHGTATSGPSKVSSENRKIRTAAGATLGAAGLLTQVIWLVLTGAALVLAGWYDKFLPDSSRKDRLTDHDQLDETLL